MENPHILFEISQLRHQDMVHEAETERLIRQLQQGQPSWLQQVGQHVAAVRAQLKARAGAQLHSLLIGPRVLRQQKKTVVGKQ